MDQCRLDGGLGEGDPKVLAAPHVVVVEVHQRLDGFLHRGHLKKSHLVVPGGGGGVKRCMSSTNRTSTKKWIKDSLEELKGFHSPTTVGEQEAQVVFTHVLPGEKDTTQWSGPL